MSGASDAAYFVGSLRTVRCQARPGMFDEERLHWDVTGVVADPSDEVSEPGDAPDLILIGELFVHSLDEAAAVTVEAMLHYDDLALARRIRDDGGQALAEVRRIAEDLKHILYDSAASVARALAALTDLALDVPGTTPDAHVSLWEPDDEEPEETTLAESEAGHSS